MREILFRGKRIDNGEWIAGFYNEVRHHDDNSHTHPFIMIPEKCVDNQQNLDFWAEVAPQTVGQFTGLTDKNGKRIFEGDLLNGFEYPFYRSEDNVHNYFAEIVWFDENCAFGLVTHKYPTSKVRGISAGNTDYIEEYDFSEWEVIGNIHDNPELLGGDS